LWDVVADKEVRRFAAHPASFNTLSVSADGTRAVSGYRTKTFVVWDVVNGKPLAELESLHEERFMVRISPDGKYIATVGSKDRQAMLWEVEQKRVIWVWKSKEKNLYGPITFLPDGRTFITAVDKEGAVALFDQRRDAPNWLRESRGEVVSGTSPDGRFALLSDGDSAVRMHDLRAGRDLGRVALPTRISGHAAISPDGRFGVATAPSDVTKGPARVYAFRLPEPPPAKKP
jgi:WD40 repeat protein